MFKIGNFSMLSKVPVKTLSLFDTIGGNIQRLKAFIYFF